MDLWHKTATHIPVLGHRGIAKHFPENTLMSFQAAIDAGVDLIEFDINVTKDNQLVVIHDNTIDRTSDHTGLTRDYTLAELKTFDFSYKYPEFKEARIPTFEEVLTLVCKNRQDFLLNVEIKDMHHSTVDDTVAMIHRFGLADRCVIASFDAEIIRYTKKAHPEMRCQGFIGKEMQNFTEETYDVMFGMGIWLGESDEEIQREIALCRQKGILAWPYSADTPEMVERFLQFDFDNITSNIAPLVLDILRKKGLHS